MQLSATYSIQLNDMLYYITSYPGFIEVNFTWPDKLFTFYFSFPLFVVTSKTQKQKHMKAPWKFLQNSCKIFNFRHQILFRLGESHEYLTEFRIPELGLGPWTDVHLRLIAIDKSISTICTNIKHMNIFLYSTNIFYICYKVSVSFSEIQIIQ